MVSVHSFRCFLLVGSVRVSQEEGTSYLSRFQYKAIPYLFCNRKSSVQVCYTGVKLLLLVLYRGQKDDEGAKKIREKIVC